MARSSQPNSGVSNGPAHAISPPLERLVFFSDAVFAIAITLLVIDIRVPRLPVGSFDSDQLAALTALAPDFLGFFISFAVIGSFWAAHHRAFQFARNWSAKLILPNLALLCAIAFIPFATAYMSANIAQRVPTILYLGVLVIAGATSLLLTHIATGEAVSDLQADGQWVTSTRARGWGITGAASLGLVIALAAPGAALLALATVPLWLRIAVRIARR